MTARLAGRIVALAFLVALPWRATAQEQPAPGTPAAEQAADVSVRGADRYFREYLEPAVKAWRESEMRDYHNPVLYDPFPVPGEPTPDRKVWHHQAAAAGYGVVLVAGDVPAVPLEWNDEPRHEMFRVYLETPSDKPASRIP